MPRYSKFLIDMSKAKETLLQVFSCEFSEVYLPGDLQDIYQWLLVLSVQQALCEKWPYSELFWSAFSCIRTEYVEILLCMKLELQSIICSLTDLSKMFCKKEVLTKNFANFTGKHLCWSITLKNIQVSSCEIC